MQLAPLKADLKVKLKDTHIKEIMWVPGVLLLTGKCQLGSKKCGMLCEVKVKRDERMWLVLVEGLHDSADEKEEVG